MKKYVYLMLVLFVPCVSAAGRLVKFHNCSGNLCRVAVDTLAGSVILESGSSVDLEEATSGTVAVFTSSGGWGTPQIFNLILLW